MKEFNEALLKAKAKFKEIKADKTQKRGNQDIPYASLYAVVNSIQTHLLEEKFLTDTHLKEKPMKDGKSELKVITKITINLLKVIPNLNLIIFIRLI